MFEDIRDRIVCKDGESISVQAGPSHYCSPRQYEGPHSSVEVGFPSVQPPDSMMEYIEPGSDDPCEAVYGWVPIEVVQEFIDAHGGVASGEWPI